MTGASLLPTDAFDLALSRAHPVHTLSALLPPPGRMLSQLRFLRHAGVHDYVTLRAVVQFFMVAFWRRRPRPAMRCRRAWGCRSRTRSSAVTGRPG